MKLPAIHPSAKSMIWRGASAKKLKRWLLLANSSAMRLRSQGERLLKELAQCLGLSPHFWSRSEVESACELRTFLGMSILALQFSKDC